MGLLHILVSALFLCYTQVLCRPPGPSYPLHCVARHPGQSHILAVGGVGDGGSSAAYIWDTRATQYPLTEVACEGRSVLEIAFQPQDPRHLYLATQKAGLLQISCRGDTVDSDYKENVKLATYALHFLPDIDSWTGFKGSRRKLVVGQATPRLHDMISFDLAGHYLVCAHSNTTIQTVVSDAYGQH